MIKLHDGGTLREFADADAIVAHFDLTALSRDDMAGAKAASDAGWPLHACLDPYAEEIRGTRSLLLETTAADLRRAYAQARRDI